MGFPLISIGFEFAPLIFVPLTQAIWEMTGTAGIIVEQISFACSQKSF